MLSSEYILTCQHLKAYKVSKQTNAYPIIHAYFIACSTPKAREKKIQECFCYPCKTRAHRLHACLDCVFFGCFEKKHIHVHAEATKHCLAIDLTFGHIYCFSCKDYMYDSEIEDTNGMLYKGPWMCIENDPKSFYECFKNVKIVRCKLLGSWEPNEKDALLLKECRKNQRFVTGKFLGLRGLVNLGNTCYMNCIVQVLTHDPLLRNYFLSDMHNIYTCRFKCEGSTCLACEVSSLFQEFYKGEQVPHISYKLVYIIWKYAKHLDGYRQQDAHELFITMLDGLHEHLKGLKEDETRCQCIIHKLYTGFLQSDVICVNCKNKRTKIDEFRDISLDLGITESAINSEKLSLNDCLNRFTQPEYIQSTCDYCKNDLSTKQLTIQKLPVVISFHLKRIEYEKKVTTFVSFPEYLCLTPFLSSIRSGLSSDTNRARSAGTSADCNFCLFAVVNHSGNREGGHYVSYIKNRQKWYKCDDDSITLSSVEDVLKSEGYLLFYHKEVLEYESSTCEKN